jgi:hypothetical protein
VLVTLSTIRQLPQAFALGDSFTQYATKTTRQSHVLIGLVDDPAHLPTGFTSPYPLLPMRDVLSETQLESLSASYTPTEFAAACKPLFISEVFRRYPDEDTFIYADPNLWFTDSLAPVETALSTANAVLTPLITRSPAQSGIVDNHWPDDKAFQNVGLYSSDFLAFCRSAETDRLLAWWDDRVRTRAYINFCEALCLDQIWLMHVPVFFKDVAVIKNPGWHVALWNLSERTIQQKATTWSVSGPAGQNKPLQFINFKGLFNPDEGLFPHQNRLRLSDRPEISTLVNAYRKTVSSHTNSSFQGIKPAYGQQPEPVVLRGWRHATVQSLRAITRFIDKVPLPAIR